MSEPLLNILNITGYITKLTIIKKKKSSLIFIDFNSSEFSDKITINVPMYSGLYPALESVIGKPLSLRIMQCTVKNISRYKLINITENIKDFL